LNWHLRFIAQYSREFRWNWRNEKIVFESRRYLRSFWIAFSFVVSWVFSERELFELTSRDEHHSRRSQSRWKSEWKSCSSQHKKSNQSEIDQSWKSDRQIYDKRTTKQTAFKVAQRLQIDRSTSKTHLKTDFIVKNLKQRWQHLRFFFLSKTIFSVFEKERSNLMMFREERNLHTNDMMKSFKKFFEDCLKKEDKWMNNKKCLIKNERKKQSFKSKIIQRLIFVLFTTHFRIHQSLFTHSSFMKDDRFRWISERISQRIRSRFWIDRSDRFHK
jgi:hypothetical protein